MAAMLEGACEKGTEPCGGGRCWGVIMLFQIVQRRIGAHQNMPHAKPSMQSNNIAAIRLEGTGWSFAMMHLPDNEAVPDDP
jgi:hypothetical protein